MEGPRLALRPLVEPWSARASCRGSTTSACRATGRVELKLVAGKVTWGPEDIQDALECARGVVRRVRAATWRPGRVKTEFMLPIERELPRSAWCVSPIRSQTTRRSGHEPDRAVREGRLHQEAAPAAGVGGDGKTSGWPTTSPGSWRAWSPSRCSRRPSPARRREILDRVLSASVMARSMARRGGDAGLPPGRRPGGAAYRDSLSPDECADTLARLVRRIERFRVQTLDAFFIGPSSSPWSSSCRPTSPSARRCRRSASPPGRGAGPRRTRGR